MNERPARPGAALVTGAAQGVGEAVMRALAARGDAVAALDCQADALREAAARVTGGRVLPIACDVADAGAVEEAVERAERELGPVVALVNAAGILHMAPALQTPEVSWQRCLAVNAGGVRNVCCAVARRMVAHGRGGAIVTIASNAARTPRVDMASYSASKAAAIAFTRVLGLELAPHGIRCNVVSPGSTDTPMQRALWKDDKAEASVIAGNPSLYRLGIPLGRIATPQDIADAALYLLSDQARHITMQELCIDGGATL